MTWSRDHHMTTYYYSQSSQPSINCKRRTSPRATMDFISKLSQVKIQGNFQQKQQLQRMYLYLVVIEVFVIWRNVSRQWRMSRKYNSYRRILLGLLGHGLRSGRTLSLLSSVMSLSVKCLKQSISSHFYCFHWHY